MIIKRVSQMTGILHEKDINVTDEQLKAWYDGELIQRAMPNLSVFDREFILSGITEEEWNAAYGAYEEIL